MNEGKGFWCTGTLELDKRQRGNSRFECGQNKSVNDDRRVTSHRCPAKKVDFSTVVYRNEQCWPLGLILANQPPTPDVYKCDRGTTSSRRHRESSLQVKGYGKL
jgi:hypothetical protein